MKITALWALSAVSLQEGVPKGEIRGPFTLPCWFYQNVRLMKALTQKGYDVNHSWGMNVHGQ